MCKLFSNQYYEPGRIILKENTDTNHKCYFLLSGSVMVMKDPKKKLGHLSKEERMRFKLLEIKVNHDKIMTKHLGNNESWLDAAPSGTGSPLSGDLLGGDYSFLPSPKSHSKSKSSGTKAQNRFQLTLAQTASSGGEPPKSTQNEPNILFEEKVTKQKDKKPAVVIEDSEDSEKSFREILNVVRGNPSVSNPSSPTRSPNRRQGLFLMKSLKPTLQLDEGEDEPIAGKLQDEAALYSPARFHFQDFSQQIVSPSNADQRSPQKLRQQPEPGFKNYFHMAEPPELSVCGQASPRSPGRHRQDSLSSLADEEGQQMGGNPLENSMGYDDFINYMGVRYEKMRVEGLNNRSEVSDEYVMILRAYLGNILRDLPAGAIFGERVVQQGVTKRTASIVAKTPCHLVVINVADYAQTLKLAATRKLHAKILTLQTTFRELAKLPSEEQFRFQFGFKELNCPQGMLVIGPDSQEQQPILLVAKGSLVITRGHSSLRIGDIKEELYSILDQISDSKWKPAGFVKTTDLPQDFDQFAKQLNKLIQRLVITLENPLLESKKQTTNLPIGRIGAGELAGCEALFFKKFLFSYKVETAVFEAYQVPKLDLQFRQTMLILAQKRILHRLRAWLSGLEDIIMRDLAGATAPKSLPPDQLLSLHPKLEEEVSRVQPVTQTTHLPKELASIGLDQKRQQMLAILRKENPRASISEPREKEILTGRH